MEREGVRIGTCGYSYPGAPPQGWYGPFYPKGRKRGFDELLYYSDFFDAVEINSSFYRPPAPSMALAWAKKTPARFEFGVKAWQKFTHPMKVGGAEAGGSWEDFSPSDIETFKSGIAPLADAGKLGVVLFQYPPGFHFTEKNAERLRRTLRCFQGYPIAVELRHRSWSDRKKEAQALLEGSRASWAVIDEPKFASSVEQEIEPSGEILYLRLHGRNRKKWWDHKEAWERYDYLYGPEEIRTLGNKIKALAQKSPAKKGYVFFNNHARGQAVANALMLKREMGEKIAPLPGSLVEAYPRLGELAGVRERETLF